MRFFKNLFLTLLLLPAISFAQTTEWNIIPDKSTLSFTATQNGAPVTGQFKKFTGDVFFDPDHLADSHVKIIVDIASVSTSYSDLTSTLSEADWFNSKAFPQAVFEAKDFKKQGANEYQANGTLKIRDKSLPVSVTFNSADFTKPATEVTGTATIKRSAFGVGQGEWASTDEVKDEVNIKFDLMVKRK